MSITERGNSFADSWSSLFELFVSVRHASSKAWLWAHLPCDAILLFIRTYSFTFASGFWAQTQAVCAGYNYTLGGPAYRLVLYKHRRSCLQNEPA